MKLYKDITRQRSFFYYYGWTILVFFGVFFLAYFLIFQAMFSVKRTEKIDLFIAAYGLKDETISKTIEKEFKKDGLIEMNIYSYVEEEYLSENYYDVSTLVESVPSISHFDTYKYEGDKPFGIKIFDGQNNEYNNRFTFTDMIKFDYQDKEKESYYLLVDNQSPNFDKDNNHTLGFSVLEYLLSSHEK